MLIILTVLFFLKFEVNCNLSLKGNFLECQIESLHNQLMLNKNCFDDEYQTKTKIPILESYEVTVLYKRPYVHKDMGFECKVKTTTMIYHTDLALNYYNEGPFIEYLNISKEDCWKMTKEKLCNNIPMNCKINKTCHFIEPRRQEYPSWIGKNKHIYYECQFNERLVTAVQKFDTIPVFHDAVGQCDINSGVCFLAKSTVVWRNNYIKYCAFEKIVKLNNVTTFKLANNNLGIVSRVDNYLFQIVDNFLECGIRMKSTTSGLYVAFEYENRNNGNLLGLQQSDLKIDYFHEKYASYLLEAEKDEKFSLFKHEINKIGCSLMMNAIQTNLHKNDTFFKLNYLNKEIVVYVQNGQAYMPLCNQVNQITILNNNASQKNKCYKDFLIQYESIGSNVSRIGFLRSQNIISFSSPKIDCESDLENELIIDNKIKLNKKRNKISTIQYTSSQIKFNNRNNQLKNIFFHHKYLTNGTDLFENLDTLLSIQNDNYASNNYINEQIFNSSNVELTHEKEFTSYFENALKSFLSILKKIFGFLSIIILIILVGLAIFYIFSFLYPPFKAYLILNYKKIIIKYTNIKVKYQNWRNESNSSFV